MDGTIRTKSFAIDLGAYGRAMWARGILRPLFFGGLAVALLALCAVASGDGATLLPVLYGLLAFLATIVVARFVSFRLLGRNRDFRRLSEDPRTMAFSIEGLRVRTQSGIESQVPWSQISHVEERGGFVLFFLGRLQHFIVPESAFASHADREALRALLAAKGIETKTRRALAS